MSRAMSEILETALLTLLVIAIAIAVLFLLHRVLSRIYRDATGMRWRRQLSMMLAMLVVTVMVVLSLPLTDTLRGQLLGLLGVLLSAAIALSSTTFIGNLMAGLMLRSEGDFKPGDFIRIGEHLGRVVEAGLFHVDLQTEDRDLLVLPNLMLVQQGIRVIRADGTFISAEVSIGYDVQRTDVSEALLEAAARAELTDAFVLIRDLLDHAVVYRVSGLLPEVKQLVVAQSRLKGLVLDALHEAGIEIVSPTFRNTRALDPASSIIPRGREPEVEDTEASSEVMFDLAEEAAGVEELRGRMTELQEDAKEIEEQLAKEEDPEAREALESRIQQMKKKAEGLADLIERRSSEDR